ncbi:MAG: hypothetical protein QOE70_4114 [Chthoniobacter sp.]|jgi:predicted secreted hydrolase|nr:hypothetical protein [Chthoniobacter sp.]
MTALPDSNRGGSWWRLLPAVLAVAGLLVSTLGIAGAAEALRDWRLALPGWKYQFDDDHFPHLDFKTEWWYFTGNLRAPNGRRFGYQLTFFRQGILPPGRRRGDPLNTMDFTFSPNHVPAALGPGDPSRFVVDDLKFAHFAITDVDGKRFHFQQKFSRGAFGEAGFAGTQDRYFKSIAWIDWWHLSYNHSMGMQTIMGGDERTQVQLFFRQPKPWAVHGVNGVSQKAAGEGHASHYYSGTRLPSSGRLKWEGQDFEVEGESWFDHEWATNQLTANQVGWNWFSIQLDDQTELMLYQMRTRDGGLDPNSSGTFVAVNGATQHLRREDYTLQPRDYWTSKATGARYPMAWDLSVPALDLRVRITTPVENQELVLNPIIYWEGVIDIDGTRASQPVRGHGYMELTGYAGKLVGLSQ